MVKNPWLALNEIVSRLSLVRRLTDPRRDIDAECGHPTSVTVQDFLEKYQRGDVAARVVCVWPEESWSRPPIVYETEDGIETDFEKAWNALLLRYPIFPMLYHADVLSGIGRYGVILIGIDDGRDLSEPADLNSRKEHQLLYLRAFDESVLSINSLITDSSHPRFGWPEYYTIQFSGVDGVSTISQKVHWSRIIHVADNRISSQIYGEPRMARVFNRILDLHKIAGGSGEMFWKGGFPGLSLEATEATTDAEVDLKSTREQLEAYMNGLQRYLATVGMKANPLPVEVADPAPHIDVQLRLIAAGIGVPWRIFIGSEASQLASEQDTRAWMRRVRGRQEGYLTPYLIRPFVERLAAMGVLPVPEKILVYWPDLENPSEKDRATIADLKANALSKYLNAGGDQVMPPFYFLTLIMGLSDGEANAALQESLGIVRREEQLLSPDNRTS